MLLFWTPDDPIPRGGSKQIYRHVELLSEAGIEARVLHERPGFVCEWFHHDAPLAYLGEGFLRRTRRQGGALLPRLKPKPDLQLVEGREVQLSGGDGTFSSYTLGPQDVIVLPEYLGALLAEAELELPLVIFNQNVHGTFRGYGYGEDVPRTVYSQPNVLGAIVVSDHNQRYLSYVFEDLDVYRVVNGVDASLFCPPVGAKRRQIAFMPRKQARQLEQLLNILRTRGALDGWELVCIDGLDEPQVARALRDAFVFLSTCHQEGFGLPPVEAGMAACLVAGYTGIAADEYFQDGLAERVPQDDVLAFAQAVERTLAWIDADESAALARGRAFSDFLTERYSLDREAESVLTVWRALLAKHQG